MTTEPCDHAYGTDPRPVPEGAWPTPAQLLHRWMTGTTEERLAFAARALDDAQFRMAHSLYGCRATTATDAALTDRTAEGGQA